MSISTPSSSLDSNSSDDVGTGVDESMTREEEEGMLVKLGPVCEEDVEGVDVIVVMLNEKEGASVEEFECSNGGVAAMVVLQHY